MKKPLDRVVTPPFMIVEKEVIQKWDDGRYITKVYVAGLSDVSNGVPVSFRFRTHTKVENILAP